ncbi:protein-disulfide reductase DsbD family protein [Phragmitibacter flavus]|nr:cytochrome c biogenesis protein CcdA [Phragmitibacter flavus]
MPLPRLSLTLLLALLPLTTPVFAQPAKPVTGTLISEKSTIAPGEPFRVAVRLDHQPGWHVYGKTIEPGAAAKPTRLLWKLPEGWTTEDLPWPATHELITTGGGKSAGYEGVVHLPTKIIPPASLNPGEKVTLEMTVDALVCDPKSCMPVKIPLTLELSVDTTSLLNADASQAFADLPSAEYPPPSAADANAATPQKSLGVMLLFGFLGGLILNIMPCVFPVLGIKITSIVNQSGDDKRRVLLHGLTYTFGVLFSFWVLVALLQTFEVSWGGQFQSPMFTFAIVLLFTVFGLNMAGLFEVGSSAVGVGSDLTRQSGLRGSFFSGLLATLVSTPCSAPFLAPALVYGLALDVLPSMLFFTVIGLGLAAPFLILSMSPGLMKLLPRPGAWMESFKQAMAFLMLGAAAYFAWSLQGLISDTAQRDLLIGLVVIAFALWIYGRWCVISKPTKTRLRGAFAAVFFLALGLWWGWPHPKDTFWKEWSPEIAQSYLDEGKTVYIDYTARWCTTCQFNKRVYNDDIKKQFEAQGIVALKADWTDYDERITAALAKLDRAAVPVNVLVIPGKDDPIILPEILTEDIVKNAIQQVPSPAS